MQKIIWRHSVKSAQIRTRKNSVFGHFSRSAENERFCEKFVSRLYFIVNIIVFMTAGILLFSVFVQVDRELYLQIRWDFTISLEGFVYFFQDSKYSWN